MFWRIFIGLGIFNAVSTCIDQICDNLNMEQTGIVGGVMLIGGIAGALILPMLSDKYKKRKPFIILCMILMLPGLAGLTFFDTFWPMLVSSFIFGFFIMIATLQRSRWYREYYYLSDKFQVFCLFSG